MSSENYHKGCSLVLCEIVDIETSTIVPIRYYLPDERIIANHALNEHRKLSPNVEPMTFAILPLDPKGGPLFPPGARR
jgi:hypothetical protein